MHNPTIYLPTGLHLPDYFHIRFQRFYFFFSSNSNLGFWVRVDEEDNMRRSKRLATQNIAAVIVALPKKKTRRSKNAAAPMSELPNDIMSDILSRLPLKSLFRCKRVCKVWRNIILEPNFAELHLSRSPLSLIFYRNGNNNKDNNNSDNSSSSHFEILQLHDPPISGYRIAQMKFNTEIYFPHMHIRVVPHVMG
ncbi:hypothetical protein RHGRI_014261 [Rhododendron griersonianum]|uniref:F-box domain-containing protein n=1 Tax=Rhododendron griersonianum TaxID=479676 RepID=A0AAV6K8Z5_9ERIC|nr:hypothetical protein RHGRI_014261 [Rhododendron griersonianum]